MERIGKGETKNEKQKSRTNNIDVNGTDGSLLCFLDFFLFLVCFGNLCDRLKFAIRIEYLVFEIETWKLLFNPLSIDEVKQ